MLLNLTNHPSSHWSNDQRKAALLAYETIVDMPFPNVNPTDSENDISELANLIVQSALSANPDAVLCQGEFSLTFALVKRFLHHNIEVICACSERVSTEETLPDGRSIKSSEFVFRRFRKYT